MPKCAATRIASRRSAFQSHGSHSGLHTLMNTPVTSKPASFNKAAETEESTPPDIPTKTFVLDLFIFLAHSHYPDLSIRSFMRRRKPRDPGVFCHSRQF